MKRIFGKFIYFIFGWKLKVAVNLEDAKHSVMLAAPHTSNWDFIFALAGFWIMGLDVKYFIKDTYTKGIHGWFFKYTGALGVDRSKRNNLVEHTISLLKNTDRLVVLVPAEGSRNRVEKWKTGFYHIALESNVPISLGYLDYVQKHGGVLDVFKPTGTFEIDMQRIEDAYKNIPGKYPDQYNPKIF